MTAPQIVDPAGVLSETLSDASPDLMRNLLQTMINALLPADADAVVVLSARNGVHPTPTARPRATAIDTENSTPESARSMSPSRNCATAPTFPNGS